MTGITPRSFGEAVSFLVLAAFVGCSTPTEPLAPAQDYISPRDYALILPDTLVDTAGTYDIRVHRVYANAREEQFLRTAESIYPPKAKKLENGKLIDEWWAGGFDGIRVDFYPTRAALDYYLATSRRFQDGDFEGTIPMQTSWLDYQSSIVWYDDVTVDGESYASVYVVNITLDWAQMCGDVCAMGFYRERKIILNADGAVLRRIDPTYGGYWVS